VKKIDLLSIYTNNHIFILHLSEGKLIKIPNNRKVNYSIFIGNYLLILFEEGNSIVLKLNFNEFTVGESEKQIEEKMEKVVRC